MLSELIDHQLRSATGFFPIVLGEGHVEEAPSLLLAQLERLRALLGSDEVSTNLDEELDEFRWRELPGGALGRRSPAVMADVAVRLFVDRKLDAYLGIYSVAEHWLGVSGPYEVRPKKLVAEFLIYVHDGDDLEDVNEHTLYLAISEAAKKSKLVRKCPNCGLPGPGWELKGGNCNSCVPRVY